MVNFTDKRSSAKHDRDVVKVESFREYFSAERSHRGVTRGELHSIIAHMENARDAVRWHRRLLRAVKGVRFSNPFAAIKQEQLAVEQHLARHPDAVKIEKGETGR